MRLCYHNSIIQ